MPDSKRVESPATEKALQQWTSMMQDPQTDMVHKMALVALDMDVLKDPEDALAGRADVAQNDRQRDSALSRLAKYWARRLPHRRNLRTSYKVQLRL